MFSNFFNMLKYGHNGSRIHLNFLGCISNGAKELNR